MKEVEENYKKLFWNLEDDYVYLDNAASTPVLKCVKEDTDNFLKTYGSIHRGAGLFSKISTDRYEEARHIIEKFVKAKEGKDVVIFTGNTTEAINKMAQIFPFKKGDYVLVSDIEHSSNLLPWQKFANVDKIKTNEYYEITKESVEEKLKENKKIRIVAIAGASNLTSLVTDIKGIYEVCKKYNVYLFIDASQMASHHEVSLEDCDFIAFSGHKMYAPYGIGVLAGRKEILNGEGFASTGGGNVCYVHEVKGAIYKDAPFKHEPGTPNGVGAIAIASSAKKLMEIGWENIYKHNMNVSKWIVKHLGNIEGVNLIFPNKKFVMENKMLTPIAVIDVEGFDNNKVAEYLCKDKIAVRAGTFCLYNLVERVKNIDSNLKENTFLKNKCSKDGCKLPSKYALIRASGGLMTTEEDYIKLAKSLKNFLKENNKKTSYEFLKKVPISINNYYGDPVIQWEDTLKKVKTLSDDLHEGPVSIITKGYITDKMASNLKKISKNLNLVVLVSVAQLPKEIESVSSENRYKSIKNLINNNIKVIGYVRPFIPPYNNNEETIEKIFKNISDAGCHDVIVSGFRGNDDILLKTKAEEKQKWVIRVKQMPKNTANIISKIAKKYDLEVFNRTSCGVAKVLGMDASFNPYYNSKITAGCNNCSLNKTCKHKKPSTKALNFIKDLGYDIEYIDEGNEECKITPENRLSCKSCCTSCFMLKVPHINVKNENITLGDIAFIRFITGCLVSKVGVVDGGKPDVGHVNFPSLKVDKYEIHCLNTWFEWARQIDRCYGCKYCIVPVYELQNKEYGCSPKELARYIDKHLYGGK